MIRISCRTLKNVFSDAEAPGVPIYRLIADIATCLSANTDVLPESETQKISLSDELTNVTRLDLVLCLPRLSPVRSKNGPSPLFESTYSLVTFPMAIV